MDTKRLQTYASFAEILAAIAIIVSLLYVATEYRQTRTMTSREADLVLFERGREANRLILENPDLAEIITIAENTPDALSRAQRLRYVTYQHDFFDAWEIAWGYHHDGILDAELWMEWNDWFAAQARQRPLFGWTANRANFTGAEFREHVDAILGVTDAD